MRLNVLMQYSPLGIINGITQNISSNGMQQSITTINRKLLLSVAPMEPEKRNCYSKLQQTWFAEKYKKGIVESVKTVL